MRCAFTRGGGPLPRAFRESEEQKKNLQRCDKRIADAGNVLIKAEVWPSIMAPLLLTAKILENGIGRSSKARMGTRISGPKASP